MQHFSVNDMSCSHCAQTVEKAVKSVDPSAKVSVDLATKAVAVDSRAAPESLLSAMRAAGYEGKTVSA